jgi:hypothetical protein
MTVKKINKDGVAVNLNDGLTYRLWRTCGCGCEQVVRGVFAQGHDMKLRSQEKAAKLAAEGK